MTRAWLVALVAWAGTARADVWKHASAQDRQRADYDNKLDDGDTLLQQAATRQLSSRLQRTLFDRAIESYRKAGELEPSEGEPYFRVGMAVYGFFLVCYDDPKAVDAPMCNPRLPMDPRRVQQALDAWDEFERRAPLDPRNTTLWDDGFSLLMKRAILETKLATRPHLEAAARLYEQVVARSESAYVSEQALGNLAEVYMMLDRLDDAIAMYRRAVRASTRASTAFGLAVALDRDERGREALDVMLAQGDPKNYLEELQEGRVFYVPAGEEYYYLALLDEAHEDFDESIENWKAYIQSGAHPEFHPRAKQHLDALLAKHKNAPPRRPRIDELPF